MTTSFWATTAAAAPLLLLLLASPSQAFVGHGAVVSATAAVRPFPTCSSPCSSSSSTATACTRLYTVKPDPLATEGDWTAYLDEETTGLVYYFNGKTGESLWEPPTESFPLVTLPRETRRMAEAKRTAYIKSLRQQAAEERAAALLQQQQQRQQQKQLAQVQAQQQQIQESYNNAETTTTNGFGTNGDAAAEPTGGWLSSMFGGGGGTNGEDPAAQEQQQQKEQKETETDTETAEDEGLKLGFLNRWRQPARLGDTPESSSSSATAATKAAPTKSAPTKSAPAKAAPVVEPVVEKPIKITAATCVIPHPERRFWGGEDAVFAVGRTFGVFDGVSKATKQDGVELYSRSLASTMRKASSPTIGMSLQELTQNMNKAKDIADRTSTGASTAIVASITEDGFLRALNVGDSKMIVVRKGRVAARTREVVHFFDCPYQLSTNSPDRPRDGTKLNIELVRGDVMVMGSDGVFDNLREDEIVDIVETGKANNSRMSNIAKAIGERSRKVSFDDNAATPYAKQAKRNGDPDYRDGVGGKLDDVSCVVVEYA